MKKIGLYPGTFDPITLGHLDIIKRAARVVDTLYVGIANNKNKQTLFSASERVEIVQKTLSSTFKNKNIKVVSFSDLTVNFCKKIKANIIFGFSTASPFKVDKNKKSIINIFFIKLHL